MNSLKYQRSTTFGCKDIEIRKSEFVVKTQFLCKNIIYIYNDNYTEHYLYLRVHCSAYISTLEN